MKKLDFLINSLSFPDRLTLSSYEKLAILRQIRRFPGAEVVIASLDRLWPFDILIQNAFCENTNPLRLPTTTFRAGKQIYKIHIYNLRKSSEIAFIFGNL